MKNSKIKVMFFSLCSFFYIYDIALTTVPSFLSTRKIVFLVMIIYLILKKRFFKINRRLAGFILSILITTCYVFFDCLFYQVLSNEYSILSRMIYFFIYGGIGTWLIILVFPSLEIFLQSIKYSGLIQSVIIYLLFFFEFFRNFAFQFILNEGNVSFLRASDRGTGFGVEGATLTIYLFLAASVCIFFYLEKKSEIQNVIILIILGISMLLVGRTGLYALLVLILLTYIRYRINTKKIVFKDIITVIVVLIICGTLIFIIQSGSVTGVRFEKMIRNFSNIINFSEDRSINSLANMIIPKIGINNFWGYGVYRGSFNGIYLQHDSGYIQSIFSLGILFFCIFYLSIFFIMKFFYSKINNKNLKFIMCFIFILLFIIEVKEPFFIKSITFSFFIVTCALNTEGKNGKTTTNINNCTNI